MVLGNTMLANVVSGLFYERSERDMVGGLFAFLMLRRSRRPTASPSWFGPALDRGLIEDKIGAAIGEAGSRGINRPLEKAREQSPRPAFVVRSIPRRDIHLLRTTTGPALDRGQFTSHGQVITGYRWS